MLHAIWHRIKWAFIFIAVTLALAAFVHEAAPVASGIGRLLGDVIGGIITIFKGGIHGAHVHIPKPKIKP